MELIAYWALIIYLDHAREIDSTFRDILLMLNRMEEDLQFTFSYEELNQIAGDLIAGKEVKL